MNERIPSTENERPCAICSGHSEEMSDRERIAQVAHQKWANEWITRFFEGIAHLLIFGQKTSASLRKPMSKFPALWYSRYSTRTYCSITVQYCIQYILIFWEISYLKRAPCSQYSHWFYEFLALSYTFYQKLKDFFTRNVYTSKRLHILFLHVQ